MSTVSDPQTYYSLYSESAPFTLTLSYVHHIGLRARSQHDRQPALSLYASESLRVADASVHLGPHLPYYSSEAASGCL